MVLNKNAQKGTKIVEVRGFISYHHSEMGLFTSSELLDKNRDKPAHGFIDVKYAYNFDDLVKGVKEFGNMNANLNYVLIHEDGRRDFTASYQDAKKHLTVPAK